MNTNINNLTTEIIKNKVKVSLSSLGLNERYNSFEYLSTIIAYLIHINSDSVESYNKALAIVEEKFHIAKISINYALKRITNTCKDPSISSKSQYNLSKYGVLNRIRVLKSYTMDNLINST